MIMNDLSISMNLVVSKDAFTEENYNNAILAAQDYLDENKMSYGDCKKSYMKYMLKEFIFDRREFLEAVAWAVAQERARQQFPKDIRDNFFLEYRRNTND